MTREGDPKGILCHLREGIENYDSELKALLDEALVLLDNRALCFKDFDPELPQKVKDFRVKRLMVN